MKNIFKAYNSTTSILLLAILGGIFGFIFPNQVDYLKPIGMLFISLLKMLIVPIIFITVLHAIISIKSEHKIIKLAGFTFGYFFVSSLVAGVVGIIIALYLDIGYVNIQLPENFFDMGDNIKNLQNSVKPLSFWDFIFGIIPNNPFLAIVEGKLISVVLFAVFLGIGITNVKHESKQSFINGVAILNEALMFIIKKIMYLAPIATFCLMAYLLGTMGFDILYQVGKLIGVVVLAQGIWVYLFLATIVAVITKKSYLSFVKQILPLQIFAFSTSSSLVSLPKNMETCDKLGVKKTVSSFVLPLGATLNMNGSSLFYAVVTIFFANMFGVSLTFGDYFLIALIATLGSMATPGVPGLSLTIVMVMVAVNVPIIGLPLIFAIDRILDMFTTTVNVIGDTSAAVIANEVI
jgi:Na+/H+-dicarboxylate symporter